MNERAKISSYCGNPRKAVVDEPSVAALLLLLLWPSTDDVADAAAPPPSADDPLVLFPLPPNNQDLMFIGAVNRNPARNN